MEDRYKPEDGKLFNGSPLIVEDIDCTMSVRTYVMPWYGGFFKMLWAHIKCRHKYKMMPWPWMPNRPYCTKCGIIQK